MDGTRSHSATATKPAPTAREDIDDITQNEPTLQKIMQLIDEAEYAKEKGQFKKYQQLLFEAWQTSKDII